MGVVYHGSHTHNLRVLEPHKSTHGEYVYATPFREISILFSKRCGDNLTFTLSRDDINKPYDLVERIPDAFEFMYTTDSSIYTLDDKTFKDINTTFGKNEVVSEKSVKVLNEEYIPNLIDELDRLEENGYIKIYRYPDRPNYIPQNDIDLLDSELDTLKRKDKEVNKNSLKRLVYLHPNLLEHVNEKLYEMDKDIITDEDMVEIFNYYKVREDIENYFSSAYELLKKYYPNIAEYIEVDDRSRK